MIDIDGSEDRHAIPRWLSIGQSIASGEIGAPPSKFNTELAQATRLSIENDFLSKLEMWRLDKDRHAAEELLCSALLSDKHDDVEVTKAAILLRDAENIHESVRQFALDFLRGNNGDTGKLPIGEAGIRQEIARRKRLINLNPRDALRMTETALLYASLGQTDASDRLLKKAIILAPNDRYVLRASSRFYAHVGDMERGLATLQKSPKTVFDPWLKAAVLATEAVLGKSPTGWRKAKMMANGGDFSDRDLSELAVQVGTLELLGGNKRQALRFMRRSAVSPTENAVAQIEWLGRSRKVFLPAGLEVDISISHEASANSAFHNADFDSSLNQCEAWREFEPFSVRPAIFGSFITSITSSETDRGISLAEAGLKANPRSVALLNNLAVLHALEGRTKEARAFLEKFHDADGEDDVDLLQYATTGLIDFRAGDIEGGIKNYMLSINKSIERKDFSSGLRAYCFMAREIFRIDKGAGQKMLKSIEDVINKVTKKAMKVPQDIIFLKDQIDARQQEYRPEAISIEKVLDISQQLSSIEDNP